MPYDVAKALAGAEPVLEAGRAGSAASGRNGGFCAASLTHALENGAGRWPGEMQE